MVSPDHDNIQSHRQHLSLDDTPVRPTSGPELIFSPEPHEHYVVNQQMNEAEFLEKIQDADYWDRYSKCPEKKRKYFFVGKEVLLYFKQFSGKRLWKTIFGLDFWKLVEACGTKSRLAR